MPTVQVMTFRAYVLAENFPLLSRDEPTLTFPETEDRLMILIKEPRWKMVPKKVGTSLPDDEYLLFASPVVYGLSLSDNIWRRFHTLYNVRCSSLTLYFQWYST